MPSRSSAKPPSRSADTGTSTAAAIARPCSIASSRVTVPSSRPRVAACPELVVANASNPRSTSTFADPRSQAFGMTRTPSRRWSSRNRSPTLIRSTRRTLPTHPPPPPEPSRALIILESGPGDGDHLGSGYGQRSSCLAGLEVDLDQVAEVVLVHVQVVVIDGERPGTVLSELVGVDGLARVPVEPHHSARCVVAGGEEDAVAVGGELH